jgi:hypothetical protein
MGLGPSVKDAKLLWTGWEEEELTPKGAKTGNIVLKKDGTPKVNFARVGIMIEWDVPSTNTAHPVRAVLSYRSGDVTFEYHPKPTYDRIGRVNGYIYAGCKVRKDKEGNITGRFRVDKIRNAFTRLTVEKEFDNPYTGKTETRQKLIGMLIRQDKQHHKFVYALRIMGEALDDRMLWSQSPTGSNKEVK